jgi:GMP synthase-like glutamine amidotransferase
MGKRVLVINNEWPGDPGLVPANTLTGITEDFYYVSNMLEQVKQFSGGEVIMVDAQELTLPAVAAFAPNYIIAGGHCNLNGWGDMDYLREYYAAECELIRTVEVPYLGICAGHQFVCMAYGMDIQPMGKDYDQPEEVGPARVSILEQAPLLAGLPDPFQVMMYHSWEVKGCSPELKTIGRTSLCRNAVVRHRERPVYGVQFHPEMLNCPTVQDGAQLLKNFFSL